MSFTDRCAASFLGLAIGDAYGRPLEFVSGPRVRELTVSLAAKDLRWTDDTHMSWFLGQAVLQMGPDRLDAEAFAEAVGERFVAWSKDPLTPSTAPGNTCMAGVRKWTQTRDWRTSGVPTSDGCGAVMRIAPLAMAFAGDDLTRAAEVQAVLTHGHPNAREAAIAGSHLLRWTLERGRFDVGMVEEAIGLLRGPWTRGGVVAEALEAAIRHSPLRGGWLDEESIPTGDGGWRSASALGLAVAACLHWGDDFMLAIDKAARIHGDSDSVAAIAGMFLGAAHGTQFLPARVVAGLPWGGRLEAMARRLGAYGQPIVAVADLHGRVDLLHSVLERFDLDYADYTLVTLGDYCDNGPDIPALLTALAHLKDARRDGFKPILGNHDLACLRAMDDPAWYKRWAARYWNPGGSTPAQFGAQSGGALRVRMGSQQRAFLERLPWFEQTERYLFVHAGMEPGPLAAQLRPLDARILPNERLFLPPQIREKGLAKVADPAWSHVVVSGHTKSHRLGAPVFEGPKRICLGADVDATGTLRAMVLPERRVVEFR